MASDVDLSARVRELENQLRIAEARARQGEDLLRIAGRSARLGGWTFDVATRTLTLSDEVCAIRELPPGTVLRIESALERYAPKSSSAITDAFERCLRDGTPYDLEAEIVTETGKLVWVRTMGQAVRAASGEIVQLQGSFQDISERKRSEAEAERLNQRLAATLERITDAFFTVDSLWRFTYVNRETERLLRHTREQMLGVSMWTLFPQAIGSISDLSYRRAIDEQRMMEFEHLFEPLGLHAEVRAYPTEEGLAVYFRDIAQRRLVEQDNARAEQTRSGLLQLQQEIGAVGLGAQAAMERICERALSLTGADSSSIELLDDSGLVVRAAAGAQAPMPGLTRRSPDPLAALALDSGEVVIVSDTASDARVPEGAYAASVCALMLAPLRDEDRLVGVFRLASQQPHRYSHQDQSTVQLLAQSCSNLLQRSRAAEALRASEAKYRLLFQSNPHPMWVYDVSNLRFLAVNAAAVHKYGYSEAEFLAMDLRSIRPAESVPLLQRALSGPDEQRRHLGLWQHRRKDGSTIDVEISSDRILFDGQIARLVLAHDVTQRLAVERELIQLNRARRLLGHCIEAQIHADSESALLAEICRIAVEAGGYLMAWIGYARHDAESTIELMAQAGNVDEYLAGLQPSWSEHQPTGNGLAGQAIRSGRAMATADFAHEPSLAPWHERAERAGISSAICLPMREGEQAFGVLCLYGESVTPVIEEEVQLLQQLADDAAFGVRNLRAQRERRRLQQAVFSVASGVSATAGNEFFEGLVRSMVDVLEADAGHVIRLDAGEPGLARSLFSLTAGAISPNFEYRLADTPCADLLERGHCTVPAQVAGAYPGDPMLRDMQVEAYVGRRLDNSRGEPIGLLFVLYHRPLQDAEFVSSTLQIFAARAAAELERLDADARIREQASLLDQAHDAIVVHRVPDHRIEYWNKGAQRLYGWSADQALDQPMDQLLRISGEEAAEPFRCVMMDGEWTGEFHECRMDGTPVLVEVHCTLVHDSHDQPRAVLSIMSDISERRRAEDDLKRALIELGNRNRELQDFAFIASHDLQEPLRKIRAFSDRLLSQAPDQISDQARDYLQRSASAAARMQTLIDDLLEYSRVDSRGRNFTTVELGPMLATVLEDLGERIEASKAEIDIGNLPTIEGDYTQLRQLFQNLLSNALKFQDPARRCRIEVRALPLPPEQRTEGYLITVTDNGIGFDPKYAERIFAPFQRLHSREDYAGTGIGLAIVRRIVERHHGRVEVSSAVGAGASFRVTLPSQQPGSREQHVTGQ
jgi:PAS domain S-box-containing protein